MAEYLPEYGVIVSGESAEADDGSSALYEANVKAELKRLADTVTGTAIFEKIKAHGAVQIKPYIKARQDLPGNGKCNAISTGIVKEDKKYRIITPLEYSPHTWSADSTCSSGPGTQADVVLIHELTHSARKLGKDFKKVPLTGTLGPYEDEEEYFGILIENIYASETGQQSNSALLTNLRANHKIGARVRHLPAHLTDSVLFLVAVPENLELVRKFCNQHPIIAPIIAIAPARFNPIAAYYKFYANNNNAVPAWGGPPPA